MTPEQVDTVESYFGPYLHTEPAYGPAMQLVAHVRELQAFVINLTDHAGMPEGPEKVATGCALQRRAQVLREKIIPLPTTKQPRS